MFDINKYVGIPFNEANCYELVRLIYKNELDIDLDKSAIQTTQSRKIFKKYIDDIAKGIYIRVDDLKQFDIVAMAYDSAHPRIVQHFGIYIGNDLMLHTLENVGAHIVDRKRYDYCIKGFYRWQPSLQ